MRVFCVVSYRGTRYYGWEKQIGQISIEEEIETALSKLYNQPINIYASGRTDAGVHAVGQTFHFDVAETRYPKEELQYRLNVMLPADIQIQSVDFLDNEEFHSRYSAVSKIYQYRISRRSKSPFRYDLACIVPSPDFSGELFFLALKKFKGQHNFMNFTSKEEDEDGFVREIFEINWGFDRENDEIYVNILGNGFMRYQIRYMIGCAIAVALGKEELSFIDDKLNNTKNRSIVSYKAPAQGLYLMQVNYK